MTSRIHRGFHRIGVVLAVSVLLTSAFEAAYELWWVWSTRRAYADLVATTPGGEPAVDAFERMAQAPHVANYSMSLFLLALALVLYAAARAVGWVLAGFLGGDRGIEP